MFAHTFCELLLDQRYAARYTAIMPDLNAGFGSTSNHGSDRRAQQHWSILPVRNKCYT
jgi:hypothetical protein